MNEKERTVFRRRLCARRQQLGWSLREAAAAVDAAKTIPNPWGPSSIGGLEEGRWWPDAIELAILAAGYHTTVEWLCGAGSEEYPPTPGQRGRTVPRDRLLALWDRLSRPQQAQALRYVRQLARQEGVENGE